MTELENRAFIKRDKPFLHFVPADIHAESFMETVKDGQQILMRPWKARNVEQHKRMFAILHEACFQSQKWPDVDELSKVLKIACGHTEPEVQPDGSIVRKPKSISYASMPAAQFERFYKRAMYCLGQMLGYDPETLLDKRAERKRSNADS